MAKRNVESGAALRVIELPEDRLYEAADVLTRSFLANPNSFTPGGPPNWTMIRHPE